MMSLDGKEKWIVRIEQDATLENHVYTTLPRLSFEITGMSYDAGRKTNRMNYITCGDSEKITRVYSPVPYNIDFKVYVYAKNVEDGTKIMEQILPYFTPDWTTTCNLIPEMEITMDIPIILTNINYEDKL